MCILGFLWSPLIAVVAQEALVVAVVVVVVVVAGVVDVTIVVARNDYLYCSSGLCS
jgi:hypothetical protein